MNWQAIIDKVKGNKWLIILAAVTVIPYFAFQNMSTRLALGTFPLDDQVTGLKINRSKLGANIIYQDGTKLAADGLGVAVLTWEDFQKTPDIFKPTSYTPLQADFPLVGFFNATGFDATGNPVCVRRASDGKQLWSAPFPGQVLAVVPLRSGGFSVYTVEKPEPTNVSEADWYAKYANIEPPAGHGLVNEKKSGLRITVFRAGGVPAVQPLKVPVHIYKGEIRPLDKYDPKDDRIAISGMSDDKGLYVVDLPPGVYTVTVEEQGGKLYGNAVRPDVWPTVTVKKDTWADYEFRRSN